MQRVKQAKLETDQAEVGYMEANLAYNITIINLAYESIPMFRDAKRSQFANMLRSVCQSRIVQTNELHGYFKFVLNFYQSCL